jgi:hypothetical protein
MTHRETLFYSLTVGFEILLCTLVYLRNLERRLPFFATHSTLLLIGTVGLALVYHHFGFQSTASFNAYWLTAGLIMVSRGFAVGELCRCELRAYRGIWALAWRALTGFGGVFPRTRGSGCVGPDRPDLDLWVDHRA